MGVSGQHHAPAVLYPRGKDPRYPLYRRLGGPQTQRLEEKSFAPAGDRTPIARSSKTHFGEKENYKKGGSKHCFTLYHFSQE
jgi:hypothetical protein